MNVNLESAEGRAELAAFYHCTLFDHVIPFWLRHGMALEHGGIMTAFDRDGSVSQRAKGNMCKGPFHLPRMLWYGARLLED